MFPFPGRAARPRRRPRRLSEAGIFRAYLQSFFDPEDRDEPKISYEQFRRMVRQREEMSRSDNGGDIQL